jgi:hypothetical protein
MLASWGGVPLNKDEKQITQSKEIEKNLACTDLVHLIFQENYNNKQRLFENSIARSTGLESGKNILFNLKILLSLDYATSLRPLLNLSSGNSQLEKMKFSKHPQFIEYSKSFRESFRSNLSLIDENPELNVETLLKIQEYYQQKTGNVGFRNTGSWVRVPISKESSLLQNKYLLSERKDGYLYTFNPSVKHLPKHVKKILSNGKPELLKEIENYNRLSIGNVYKLNKKLMTFLINDLFQKFQKENLLKKSISTRKEEKKYITNTTELFLNLLAIKPFTDHSQSISRDIVFNLLFEKVSLLKPRIYLPKDPFLYSLEEWNTLVVSGMQKTDEIYQAVLKRIDLSLPVSNTPELLSHVRSFAHNNLFDGTVNSSQFKTFLRQVVLNDPEKMVDLNNDPFLLSNKMMKQYKTYMNKYGLNVDSDIYVSDDFSFSFQHPTYHSSSSWNYKMKHFYKKKLLWKDIYLPFKTKDQLNLDIVSLFKNVTAINHSRPDKLISKSFDEFNQDMIRGEFNYSVDDIVNQNEHSKYAYGFLVYKNINHLKKEISLKRNTKAQKKISILVGLKKSRKDLDLKDFYKKDPSFSHQVLAVGGIDPDAIMVIHTISPSGEILSSYIRDEERPWRVQIFEGNENIQKVKNRYPASIINISD